MRLAHAAWLEMLWCAIADVELWKPPELFEYTSVSGYTIHGMMYTPAGLDANKKYPVVLYVYAGPHVQLATNTYKTMRFIYLLWSSAISCISLSNVLYVMYEVPIQCCDTVLCNREGMPKNLYIGISESFLFGRFFATLPDPRVDM